MNDLIRVDPVDAIRKLNYRDVQKISVREQPPSYKNSNDNSDIFGKKKRSV